MRLNNPNELRLFLFLQLFLLFEQACWVYASPDNIMHFLGDPCLVWSSQIPKKKQLFLWNGGWIRALDRFPLLDQSILCFQFVTVMMLASTLHWQRCWDWDFFPHHPWWSSQWRRLVSICFQKFWSSYKLSSSSCLKKNFVGAWYCHMKKLWIWDKL